MLKKINEAIVGEYRFVSSADYFSINLVNGNDEDAVVITPEEFHEVVEWFMTDCQPSASKLTGADKVEYDKKDFDRMILEKLKELNHTPMVDPLANRKAAATDAIPGGASGSDLGYTTGDLGALKGPVTKGRVVKVGVEAHEAPQALALRPESRA